ncbi:S41 family peptidase [Porphyromonas sp. COT-290 OH860]|uniref:S41 family peptidase n=1 Tax=Porphyromonas sp. COT-290 OH860 TaxID=1515615 RepID=UPI00126A6855|nr:S41 family peptidase [Porphyromonas sp. COT-290 OH860]
MNLKKLMVCIIASSALGTATAAEEPLWLRYPSISPDGTQIAFTYKGDIYTVPASGGEAKRLTAHEAYDSCPIWSPDGKQIAFVSDRNKLGVNIYLMHAQGGQARQLTTHSGTETPYSFTPDGKHIVFKAQIQDEAKSTLFPSKGRTELYQVATTGGRPELLLGIPAEYATVTAEGKILYHDHKGAENEWRKHHTSSIARDIMEYDPKGQTFRQLTHNAGEDRNPVYSADKKHIYYLSEQGGKTMNVYRLGLSSTQPTALTNFTGEPVRFLSASREDKLCFGYAGQIYTMMPGQAPQLVSVRIINDVQDTELASLKAGREVRDTEVSPDGKLIAFTFRGEVFVSSADHKTTKRITTTPAVERGLTFGSDSRSLVYASARDGLFDLYKAEIVREQDPDFANATLVRETKLLPSIKGEKAYPKFSPDGREIAFVLNRKVLAVYNFATGKLRELTDERTMHDGTGAIEYAWSPDSKWIALSYVARAHAPYYDVGIVAANGDSPVRNLTNSGYFAHSPRWSADGNALIYRTDMYGMRNHASWGSLADVMMVFLNRKAYEQYKMTEEEHELNKPKEAKAKEGEKGGKDKPKASTPSIEIEWDNIEDRHVRLTPNSSDLGDAILSPDGKKLYYFSSVEQKYDLWVHDLRKKTTKLLKKMDAGSVAFATDKEGKSVFVLGDQSGKLNPKDDSFKAISLSAELDLDRANERVAMFDEVEREQGLRFYRSDMHGVDWPALTKYYRRYLPHINNNHDFAEMLSELLGELNVSHTGSGYRGSSAAKPTAELGLFFAPSRGQDGLVVDEVVAGGPLDISESRMKKGDTLLSIDGVEIKAGMDYFPLLNGKAGKRMLITYRSAEAGKTLDLIVKPISSGALQRLLYKRWVKQRAEIVERLSGGQLGYVHIPSMGDPSFRTAYADVLGRYYGRKGIVIDIRHNGGGRLHEDIEVFFTGKKYLQQEIRGKDYCEMPSRRWNHASIMLVCEDDYSNAHGTPWVYQKLKIGKVVGMPVPGTMTSVNWVTLQDPSLYFGIPAVGYRTAEGDYLENKQLEPDVRIPLDPKKALEGTDTQLEAAVRILLEDLKG